MSHIFASRDFQNVESEFFLFLNLFGFVIQYLSDNGDDIIIIMQQEFFLKI